MMKAAMYETFGGPITVQEVPIPSVPDNGVLIHVVATGVCRSDWHGWKGHDGDVIEHGLPIVPGHEFSGVVAKVGRQTRRFQVGDRVAIPFILSCGNCRYCTGENKKKKQPTICAQQEQPGFTRWGSFAEYVAVPRADRNLRHLPPKVSFLQAAALGCRFTTAYRAVLQQGELQAGQSVAIFGCGGLGLSCVQMAASKQASQIIAVDISPLALEKAKTLGATHTILVLAAKSQSAKLQSQDPKDIAEQVANLTSSQDGADLTVDAAGFASTRESAVYATRPGGRMVQVGLPHTPPKIPMGLVAGRELTILGSHGFDAQDLPDLLEMIATNPKLDPCLLVERQVSLEQGCAVLQDMDRESPLGMVMITNFGTTTTSSSRL
jgi:alcohol dehydrogenase